MLIQSAEVSAGKISFLRCCQHEILTCVKTQAFSCKTSVTISVSFLVFISLSVFGLINVNGIQLMRINLLSPLQDLPMSYCKSIDGLLIQFYIRNRAPNCLNATQYWLLFHGIVDMLWFHFVLLDLILLSVTIMENRTSNFLSVVKGMTKLLCWTFVSCQVNSLLKIHDELIFLWE